TASSLIRTTGQLAPGAAAGSEEEAKPQPEQPVIRLDETQERISKLDINNPLLIVAGAGSGKTSTLCARVIEIMRQGVRPQSILVITFTNKAANELKDRIFKYMKASGMLDIAGVVEDGASEEEQKRRAFSHMPHASTFHSWCYGLMMRYYKELGWSKCPMVAATESEHKKILKLAIDQLEDCRRLVQCEFMLGIAPPASLEEEEETEQPSIFIPDAEERWEVVLQKAQERTGFSVDAYKRLLEEEGVQGHYKPPKTGRATKFGERATATAEHLSLMRYLYGHLYVEIGSGRGLVDYNENPINYSTSFGGKDLMSQIMNFIYHAKARGHSSTAYPQLERSVLEAYNATLRRFNLVDFDDLLMFANKVLEDRDILGLVRNEYQYLLLDEFQDFNKLQTDLVLRLQVGIGRVTAVGDERQSIYAFRGAACENNFRLFLERFVDAQVEKNTLEGPSTNVVAAPVTGRGSMESLTRNYRSHRGIVDLGNIVARDTIGNSDLLRRLRVPLHALDSVPVVPVSVWDTRDDEEEARIFVRRIKSLLDKKECKGSDIAILSRCLNFGAHRPTGKIEAELLRNGIQYVLRGGHSALKSKRMQIFMALVRVVANPEDDIAVDYCLDALVNNVGPAAITKIKESGSLGRLGRMSLFDKAERASTNTSLLPKNARAGLQAFIDDVRRWQMEIDSKSLDEIIRAMFKEYIMEVEEDAGMAEALKGEQDDETEEEIDPVLNIALAIKDSLYQSPDLLSSEVTEGGELDPDAPCSMMLLRAYSSQLCLLSSSTEDKGVVKKPKGAQQQKGAAYESAVVISTVHQAKGLEWEHVFLPQFNECLFPMNFRGPSSADRARAILDPQLQREISQASHQHYREEGRLAYVAITRAKKGLYISVLQKYPLTWMLSVFGPCMPSQYLPDVMYGSNKAANRSAKEESQKHW
ncbi:hypothetical protein H4R20_002719, partial [Coemansia guatemalensis]